MRNARNFTLLFRMDMNPIECIKYAYLKSSPKVGIASNFEHNKVKSRAAAESYIAV